MRVVAWLVRLREKKYHQSGQLHSDGKIELFYKSVILILLLTSLMLAVLGGVTISRDPAQPAAQPSSAKKEGALPAPTAAPPPPSAPPLASPPPSPATPTPSRR